MDRSKALKIRAVRPPAEIGLRRMVVGATGQTGPAVRSAILAARFFERISSGSAQHAVRRKGAWKGAKPVLAYASEMRAAEI